MFDLIAFLGEGNPFVAILRQAAERRAAAETNRGVAGLTGIFGQAGMTEAVSGYCGEPFDVEFVSCCEEEDDAYWHAEFCVSPGVGPDDSLLIFINDAEGNPLQGGRFVFLGLPLDIKNGVSECPFVHLRDNMSKSTDVYVQHDNGMRVPGHLG